MAEIPTLRDWKNQSSAWFTLRTSDPVLARIDKLIEMYHDLQFIDSRLDLVYHMYSAAVFWLENANTVRTDRTKVLNVRDSRRAPITNLRGKCREILEEQMEAKGEDFEARLFEQFGRTVRETLRESDMKSSEKLGFNYITEESGRRRFKLSFRNGQAYRWTYSLEGEKQELKKYDTEESRDTGFRKGETDVGLFVMGTNGNIYTGNDKMTKSRTWFHSCYFAGQTVFAAGMLRVERGKVRIISGNSGHYQPRAIHILAVLQKLLFHKVDMTRITVRRTNTNMEGDIEECRARDFIAHSGWPTGVEKDSMCVENSK